MTRRRTLVLLGALAVLAAGSGAFCVAMRFPPDTTPEGVYLRIAKSVSRGDVRGCFAYLEDEAQHAAYSIREYRQRAFDRVTSSYPEPERTRLLDAYRGHATAPDGADVWLDLAERRGWTARLRRDLSGIAKLEIVGERATVETARGTRYAFRRRENGIWGLTLFTGELVGEAEKAARDWEVIQRAADDYDRGRR
jgi:hypothetical protein